MREKCDTDSAAASTTTSQPQQVWRDCNHYPAIEVSQLMSCNRSPAIEVLRSKSCINVLQSSPNLTANSKVGCAIPWHVLHLPAKTTSEAMPAAWQSCHWQRWRCVPVR